MIRWLLERWRARRRERVYREIRREIERALTARRVN